MSDQTATATTYDAWLRRLLPEGAPAPTQVYVGRYQSPQSFRARLGAVSLAGFDERVDRVLILMDWEDDWAPRRAHERSNKVRQTVQAARNVFEERYHIAETDRVRAYLIPPTTEGWYLLLAEADQAMFELLAAACDARELRSKIAARLAHAREPHVYPPPKKPDVARLLDVRRDVPKRRLAERVAAHLEQTPRPDPQEIASWPAPCLRAIAVWLRDWR